MGGGGGGVGGGARESAYCHNADRIQRGEELNSMNAMLIDDSGCDNKAPSCGFLRMIQRVLEFVPIFDKLLLTHS